MLRIAGQRTDQDQWCYQDHGSKVRSRVNGNKQTQTTKINGPADHSEPMAQRSRCALSTVDRAWVVAPSVGPLHQQLPAAAPVVWEALAVEHSPRRRHIGLVHEVQDRTFNKHCQHRMQAKPTALLVLHQSLEQQACCTKCKIAADGSPSLYNTLRVSWSHTGPLINPDELRQMFAMVS